MGQSLQLEISGIKNNPNNLIPGAAPGSLNVASNVNVDSPNTAVSRRGFYPYTTVASGKIGHTTVFSGDFVSHLPVQSKCSQFDGSTWRDYAAVMAAPDTDVGMRFYAYNRSIFAATDAGAKKLENPDGEWRDAGVSRALNIEAALTGAAGFMATNTQVAYRCLFGYTDANGLVVLGSPSDRAEIANATGGARNVNVTCYIPQGVSAGYYCQLYRSAQSVTSATQANDKLGLVYEKILAAGDITAGYITILDIVTDALRGAEIYTSPNQEGIALTNKQPPRAVDVTVYKDCAFYANTRTRHQNYITLITAAAASGGSLVNGDTVTIGGYVYTAGAAENIGTRTFALSTLATPGDAIAVTARSLVKCVNLNTSNTIVSGYYISGYDDLPGQMVFERRDLTDTVFTAACSRAGCFSPDINTTAQSSENEARAARIYFSKPGIVDAVPDGYAIDAGADLYAITRIIALRDSIFVVKENGEIWRIVGEDPGSFSIRRFDSTARLYGARTAVVFSNQIYIYSDQGVASVSDAGVQIKAFNIENQLMQYLSSDLFPTFKADAHAVAYESGRKYVLFCPDRAWVFNVLTNSWTTWDTIGTASFHNYLDDRIYYAKSDFTIWRERKDYTPLDYCDGRTGTAVSAPSGFTATLTTLPTVGQGVYQSNLKKAVVVSLAGSVVTFDRIVSWDVGTAYIVSPIKCELKFAPLHMNNPGVMKRFREITAYFRDMNSEFSVYFSTNFDPSENDQITVSPAVATIGWGTFGWGMVPWGGNATTNQEKRVSWPLTKSRGLWGNVRLTTNRPFTSYTLNGVSVVFEQVSNKFKAA